MVQPLEGIRVLEMAAFHAGPAGTAILGDLGAEVIKIEQPGVGDPIRGSYRIGQISLEISDGMSLWNEGSNRSKKSITLDLTTARGREIAYRLASKSDVFLTNLRRQAVEKVKMEYSMLTHYNPQIIYAWVSAYGPKGPDSERGGFDFQGQGRSGMMFSIGEEGSHPLLSQFGIVDQATAIMASHEILAALFMRERTGIGQEIHVSILGTALYLLYMNVEMALLGNFEVPRHTRPKEHALRNYYCCADDQWLIVTLPAIKQQEQWHTFCEILQYPELEYDSRFDTDDKRHDNAGQLVAILDQVFVTKPRDEWLRSLADRDLIACRVNRPSDLTNDPQIMENDYIVDFDHPVLGKIQIPGYPVHFSKSWAGTKLAAPELGQHTEEILTEIGGYTKEEIAQFREKSII
ncbi:MAG: CoA transferase [Chloroflexota bacterium]|nr:CoA transferase [Chloroflexota bacterium]